MIHEATIAAVSAAVGALTMPALHKLWSCLHPTPPPGKPPLFDPGLCDELPIHAWEWNHNTKAFVCPKCHSFNKQQPAYCPERGGHFHFKCIGNNTTNGCGYEWAMRTVDTVPAVKAEPPTPSPDFFPDPFTSSNPPDSGGA
jgi:hypothetical protein